MMKVELIKTDTGQMFKFSGLGEKLAGFSQDARDYVFAVLDQIATVIRNEAMQGMDNSPATGRMYRVGKGRFHIASSPGNPPRVNTGNLVNSITMDANDNEGTIEVGSNITDPPYGAYLEFGTKGSGKNPGIKPRPWLGPVLNRRKEHINKRVLEAIQEAAQGNF